jgi:ArsR family metal-binding transcriptional regulator
MEDVQLAQSALQAARELFAARADGDGAASISTLSIRIGCVVCFALLRKAKTLHCGHSVCAACATKLVATNLCPLPGPACRSLEKLVIFHTLNPRPHTRNPKT